jgi:large subunit ribosomal protein L29
MRAKDLRERSVEDLRELEKSLKTDSFQNRLKNFTNRLDDTSSIKKSRRDLARVLTILRERQGGAAVAAPKPAKAPKAKAAPKAEAKAAPAAAPSKPAVAEEGEKKTTSKKAAPAKKAAKPKAEKA